MIDYGKYVFNKKEILQYGIGALGLVWGISYLFYQSIVVCIILSPLVIVLMRYEKKSLIKKRRWELNLQFKEGITSISAALSIGYSMENAVRESITDLSTMMDSNSYIIQELENILRSIQNNIPVEQAFLEFSLRAGVEDITNFVDVFVTAKRSGGDLIKIMGGTSKNIGDKLEIKREIQSIIAGKKLESQIMSVIPLGMIVYMWISSPGYLSVLYHNLVGIVIMTIMLGLYIAAYFLLQRMVEITV